MSIFKLPKTDEERISVLQTMIAQEEINEDSKKILSFIEIHELQTFVTTFEGAFHVYNQTQNNVMKAKNSYENLFKNARLYLSHFIQVLILTVIRNEIKAELLPLYGLPEINPVLPDISTEEAILTWGENLIRGEYDRTCNGGFPIQNPSIAKVKVHYELFRESIHSLTIYEKNFNRISLSIDDMRNNADEFIRKIWTRVEERCARISPEEQSLIFSSYKIQFYSYRGKQLSVFDW